MRSPADRMAMLSTHFFARLFNRIKILESEGKDIIRLDEGSPDLPPAHFIIDALTRSAARPDTHRYQPHRGIYAYRQAWSTMYQRVFQVDVDPDSEIVPLLGSKEGIFHFLQAWVQPGDLVLVPDPGYITYSRGTLFAGGQTYAMPLSAANNYFPDLSTIPDGIARQAKIIWLNYPSNPTAAIATLDQFQQSVDFAKTYDLLICHDAAYTQVLFDDERPISILNVPGAKDVAIEFNSLSKSHNMAGWRLGAAVGNKNALSALFTLKTNADSSHFLPIIEGAIAAMTGDQDWLNERNAIYQRRRDIVVHSLHKLGLAAPNPSGSLYVWSPIPHGWTAEQFSAELLDNTGVSVTPGTVFGENGEGFIRISLTEPEERIELAMQRIEEWMQP